jgi:hypothetical protein
MARPRSNPKGPKRPLPVRIDVDLAVWLAGVAHREGWSLTEATEWALSGVRYLEVKLAARLEDLLQEQRTGGDDVFTALRARVEEAFAREGISELKPIVPHHKKKRIPGKSS